MYMQQSWANLNNVSRISRIVDHGGAILANVSKSPHVDGVGCQVSIFEECIGSFASVRKHRVLRIFMRVVSMGVGSDFGHPFFDNVSRKNPICPIWTPLGQGGCPNFLTNVSKKTQIWTLGQLFLKKLFLGKKF